jgi:hypothetical protein
MFADKLADAANLAIGGLVFGQLLAIGSFSVLLALVGLALWGALIWLAAVAAGGVDQ